MIILIACTMLCALAMALGAQPYIHILQGEGYKLNKAQHMVRLSPRRYHGVFYCALLYALLVQLALLGLYVGGGILIAGRVRLPLGVPVVQALAALGTQAVLLHHRAKRPQKKPLVYTARVKRLLVCLGLLALAVGGAFYPLYNWLPQRFGWDSQLLYLQYVLMLLMAQAVLAGLYPFMVMLAVTIMQPIENLIKLRYYLQARRRLDGMTGTVKVGITGSFGKTSCKMILHSILSVRYNAYATPHSYNTPMGVTRAVREQLRDDCEVFIAEMGARHRGDIAEMCDLVAPRYGIITSVGAQHLETMHNLETVAATKNELVEALPADGMAFFPADGAWCETLYDRAQVPKALYGLQDESERPLYMTARDITTDPQGSSFELVNARGEAVRCTTRLLGRHNVRNITGCAALAWALGMTMPQIAQGIHTIEPVEHRLQLLPGANGVSVIDDAFNSNPAGARAALEVLSTFPGRKIIVTPGLVELGEYQYSENLAFGQAMASVVDMALLVAHNAAAMREGLVQAGFDPCGVHVLGSLAQATQLLGTLTQPGDVILFENDLPDSYEQ